MKINCFILLFFIAHLSLLINSLPRNLPKKPHIELSDSELGPANVHLMHIKVGEPPQIVNLKLSTSFCGIYILNKKYFNKGMSLDDSHSARTINIDAKLNDYSGVLVQDLIEIPSFPKIEFSFLLINKSPKEFKTYDGAIGFGTNCNSKYNIEKSQYSVDLLPLLTTGQKQIFSIYMESKSDIAIFNMGGLPDEYLQLKSKYLYKRFPISINYKTNSWELKLHSIYTSDGGLFNVNENIAIGSTGAMIAVNQQFFSFLIWKYFLNSDADLSFNSNCFQSSTTINEIYCNDQFDISKIGELSFVIGKITIKIPPEKLFYQVNRSGFKQNWFSVVYYPGVDKWYISQKLLGDATVVYDNENKEIGIIYNKFINQIDGN